MTELTKLTDTQAMALENAQARADDKPVPHRLRQRGGGNSVGRMIERLDRLGLMRDRDGTAQAGHITDKGRQVLADHQARKAALASKREAAAAAPVKLANLVRFDDLVVARVDLPQPFVQGLAVWGDASRTRFTWRSGSTDTESLTLYATPVGDPRGGRPIDRPAPGKVAAILAAIEADAGPAIAAAKADHDVIEAERARRGAARLAYHHQRDAGPALAAALQAMIDATTDDGLARSVDQAGAVEQAHAAMALANGEGLATYMVGAERDRLHHHIRAANADAARTAFAYGHSFSRNYVDGALPPRPVDVFVKAGE